MKGRGWKEDTMIAGAVLAMIAHAALLAWWWSGLG